MEVAEAFNAYYTNVAKDIGKDSPYINDIDNHPSLEVIDNHAQDISLPDFSFRTMTEKDIKDIIDRLPTGKAPGYDNITGKCIKAVDSIIVRNMAGGICSLSTTILETEWKPFFGGPDT